MDPEDKNLIHSQCNYNGFLYCSSIKHDNLLATQFHPEKSGTTGLNLIKEFLLEANQHERNY